MGIFDNLPFSSLSADGDMSKRLDRVAKLSIENVDIPSEFRPTDLEAWLFAPAGTRVGVLGEPQGNNQSELTPELVELIKDRFERLETALDLMETNIKITQQQTAEMASSSMGSIPMTENTSQDMIHSVGADGEVVSKPAIDLTPTSIPHIEHGHKGGPSLLDLYEAQSLAVNPFLKSSDAGELLAGPQIDSAKLAALLLDNMSGSDALRFIKNAGSSGIISGPEKDSLSAIVALAEPGEQSEGPPTLSNRSLLTFAAMVDAWRSQLSQKEG
jgi:hypothetical protein